MTSKKTKKTTSPPQSKSQEFHFGKRPEKIDKYELIINGRPRIYTIIEEIENSYPPDEDLPHD